MNKKIGLLLIGDELLDNTTNDINSNFFKSYVTNLGYELNKIIFVSDNINEIVSSLQFMLKSCDVVVSSGGLGPTDDDKTRFAVAEFLGTDLKYDKKAYDRLSILLKNKGVTNISDENKIQAYLPEKANWIDNNVGTANGIIADLFMGDIKKNIICFPGVPSEFQDMVEKYFGLNKINNNITTIIKFRFFGISESKLQQEWRRLEIVNKTSFLPTLENGILVKIYNCSESLKELILKELSDFIISDKGLTLEEEVVEFLKTMKLFIATAESCSAGYIASKLANVSGASKILRGSIVAYQDIVKIKELGIDENVITNNGVVSDAVARCMSTNISLKLKSDISIAVTGYIGPNGGDEFARNGDVYMAVNIGTNIFSKKINVFPSNSRIYNRIKVSNSALFFLLKKLREHYNLKFL